MDEMQELLEALAGLRLPVVREEREICLAIERALTERGIPFVREARLGPAARVDFLCGCVALEVKKGRPDRRTLLRQLMRYAASEQVHALVLVTERSAALPASVGGKPLRLVALNRLWGVAL